MSLSDFHITFYFIIYSFYYSYLFIHLKNYKSNKEMQQHDFKNWLKTEL